MPDNYDATKVIECLFDPQVSEILAELEHEEKGSGYLAEKLGISEDDIRDRLSYLVETGFVRFLNSFYSVDSEKISNVMENDENYKGVVDGLTELDSYLN